VPPAERRLLLVLRALGLGDLLTALPALRALRDAHPDHRIALAAPRALHELALHSGAVDTAIDAAPLQPIDLRGLPAPGIAVNLHGRGPQSTAVLRDTSPSRLVAFDAGACPPRWRDDEHEVLRWCRLLGEGMGVATDPSRLDIAPPRNDVPRPAHGATLIHPGAAYAARRWPAERWAAVAREEQRRGHHVVVSGGAAEVDLARDVARRAGLRRDRVLAGSLSVLDLCATVAASARVVCGDTGVAHVATALRRPSVVLFGPTPPSLWGPPPHPRHRVIWHGSTGDSRAGSTDPGLLRITVDEVLAELDALNEQANQAYADSSRRSLRSSSADTARRSRTTQGSPPTASRSAPSAVARP
jgi:ADP-heptose:LPS heptosyltransferase